MDPDTSLETKSIIHRFIGDVVSAGLASFAVSPFIAIIDRAIIENANGKRPLVEGLKQLSKDFLVAPHQFIRRPEFLFTFGLYAATYVTANVMDTVSTEAGITSSIPKLVATAAVNVSLCVAKDRVFTQLFGKTLKHKMPLKSYTLFTIRDSLTVLSSFWIPQHLAVYLETLDVSSPQSTAQFLSPATMQLISAPLHLLALDFYNRPAESIAARGLFIRSEYFKTAFARTARIGPAFGIGGVVNGQLRQKLHMTNPNIVKLSLPQAIVE